VQPIPAVDELSRDRAIRAIREPGNSKKLSFKNLPLAARLRPAALRKAVTAGGSAVIGARGGAVENPLTAASAVKSKK